MAEIKGGNFTINGVTTGTVDIPCDGVTTVPISFTVNVEFFYWDGPFEDVPIWIGERRAFFLPDKTLIKSTVRVTNPGAVRGAPAVGTTTASFTLMCSTVCRLTPGGGPAGTVLVPDGTRMVLSCAFRDRFSPPFFKWWYKQNKVTVRCVTGATTVTATPKG